MLSWHRRAALVVAMGLLAASAAPLQAAQDGDYSQDSWLSPRDPQIGETYQLTIRVTNHSGRWILFQPQIDSLPQGDTLMGRRRLQASVEPGGTVTFRFNIRCGVLGGTVRHNMRVSWDD